SCSASCYVSSRAVSGKMCENLGYVIKHVDLWSPSALLPIVPEGSVYWILHWTYDLNIAKRDGWLSDRTSEDAHWCIEVSQR
ncbi:MAG: hypothetical protein ACKPKO_53950, partial [Candidatus Fonsibacter sp.]